MNTSENKYDSLESLIYEEGLRIETIDVHQDMNLFLVILNTKAILRQKISAYARLKNATEEQLKQYELIGNGTGVYWPALDEDLSLKGFLRNELRNLVGNVGDVLTA
jgi:hypothetical protein